MDVDRPTLQALVAAGRLRLEDLDLYYAETRHRAAPLDDVLVAEAGLAPAAIAAAAEIGHLAAAGLTLDAARWDELAAALGLDAAGMNRLLRAFPQVNIPPPPATPPPRPLHGPTTPTASPAPAATPSPAAASVPAAAALTPDTDLTHIAGEQTLGDLLSATSRAPGVTSFGRYQLRAKLGAGGMGEVYRAYDPHLEREVALKVMRPERTDENCRRRFKQEAAVMARLQHPNILPVYDRGEEQDRLFYTMELIRGESVREVLRRLGRIPARAALRIVRDVARGLHHAHMNGIIHRDVKPENILLTARVAREPEDDRPDDEGHLELGSGIAGRVRPLVVDFGLARDLERSQLTQSGVLLGTIAYMSPEQADSLPSLGPAADVYSLGATLYEMIAGTAPFAGKTGAETLAAILFEDPPPLKNHVPSLHPDVATLCEKAMAKDAARRYATAAELARDIERYLRGEAIHARPAGSLYKLWLRARRHKVASLALAALAATLCAVGANAWFAPGTLNLNVTPAGARVRIGARAWTAPEGPLPVALAAGTYEIEVEAPAHAPASRVVVVERDRMRDVTIALAHDLGTLEAESEPRGSEIEVDGVAYGSRVRNLALPTGRHRLRAWAAGHLEREAEVEIRRGETARAYLWLEPAVAWTRESSGIPAGGPAQPLLLRPGPEGTPALVHQDGTEFVVCALRTGAEIGRLHGGSSVSCRCELMDLGGSVGPALVVSTEETTGTVVTCLDPRRTPAASLRWQWVGPRQAWTQPRTPFILPGNDSTGDGVRELAVVDRTGDVRLLDGSTGKETAHHAIGGGPAAIAPLDAARADRLLFVARPAAGDAPIAGCLRLSDGGLDWSERLPADAVTVLRHLDRGGAAGLYWCTAREQGVLDGRTGRTRWRAALPGTAGRGPILLACADLDADGTVDVLLQGEGSGLCAVSGKDGRPLWTRTPEAPPRGWGAAQSAAALPGGAALVVTGASAIAVVDARTGANRWVCAGRFRGLSLADVDGDGQVEILAGLQGVGLACLDPDGRRAWTVHLDQDVVPAGPVPDLDGEGLPGIYVHGGQALVGVVRPPRRLWVRRAAGPLLATPVVADLDGDGRPEVVQLGPWGQDRRLACFDGASGLLRWSRVEDFPPNRGPGMGDLDGDRLPDLVLPGSRPPDPTHFLWSFRGRDGAPLHAWPLETGATYSTPVVADLDGDGVPDVAFHRWDSQDVVAYDGRTGKRRWRYATGGPAMGGVGSADLDGDGRPDLVAPVMDGRVYALRGTDGTLLWQAELDGGGSRCAPTLADVTGDGTPDVLLMSRAGTLWVLDGRTGREVWRVAGAPEPMGRPAVARPAAGKTLLLAPMGAAGVKAFRVEGRELLWQAPEGKTVLASPLACDLDGDGELEAVIATADGWVDVRDLVTGRRLWAQRVGDKQIEADPVAADLDGDGVLDLVIADHAGALTVLSGRPTTGARRR